MATTVSDYARALVTRLNGLDPSDWEPVITEAIREVRADGWQGGYEGDPSNYIDGPFKYLGLSCQTRSP